MTTIQARFPSHILAQVQHEVHDLKEDFLSFIYEINRNEKPIWTILKEMKDTIPIFIDQHILKVLAQKYDTNVIKELKRKMPKKSLMNCRQQLNSLINAIEQENLLPEYIKTLVMIINNTTNNGQEVSYQRHSKNWKNSIKNRLLALMLLVYQFSLEKQKNIFNIVDLWYKIYPETPVWQLKDERFSSSQSQDNKQETNIDSNQQDSGTNHRISTKEMNKTGKSSSKKCQNKDDLISYELELLELEFNRNLRISNAPHEEKKKQSKREKDMHNDIFENDSSSNGMNQVYEDEESTTQEEECEDDSMSNHYNQDTAIKGQQGSRKKQRRIQTNFVKQTRKGRNEVFSPAKQISDLACQFDQIHIEAEQNPILNNNHQVISQISNACEVQQSRNIHFLHTFSLENNNPSNTNIQIPHFQSSPFLPLNDTTNVLSIKKNLSQLNLASNSPQEHYHSSTQSSHLLTQPNFNLQNENSQPVYYHDNQQQIQQQNQKMQPLGLIPHQHQIPTIPILRNPCHQIFEVPLKDSTNSINYFISSQ